MWKENRINNENNSVHQWLLSTPPAWVGRSVASLCVCVCVCVCLFVRALTKTRLELSTPNLVHVYSIAATQQRVEPRAVDSRTHPGPSWRRVLDARDYVTEGQPYNPSRIIIIIIYLLHQKVAET